MWQPTIVPFKPQLWVCGSIIQLQYLPENTSEDCLVNRSIWEPGTVLSAPDKLCRKQQLPLCHNNPGVNTIHHWNASMSPRSHQISVFILPIETLTSHLSANVNTFTRHRGNQANQVFWPTNLLTEALDLGSAVSSGRIFGKIKPQHLWPRPPES